jgi:hypothetical protein
MFDGGRDYARLHLTVTYVLQTPLQNRNTRV